MSVESTEQGFNIGAETTGTGINRGYEGATPYPLKKFCSYLLLKIWNFVFSPLFA